MRQASDIHLSTVNFPRHEWYGLSQQMRRAAVSIASNIAEGKVQGTNRGFCQFLYHTRGSLLELETQIDIAEELEYLKLEDAQSLRAQATAIGRSLSGLINSLNTSPGPTEVLAEDRRPTTNDHV
jgi:four helix bundle protein